MTRGIRYCILLDDSPWWHILVLTRGSRTERLFTPNYLPDNSSRLFRGGNISDLDPDRDDGRRVEFPDQAQKLSPVFHPL